MRSRTSKRQIKKGRLSMKKKQNNIHSARIIEGNNRIQRSAVPTYSFWFYLIPPTILAGLTAIFYLPSLHYAFQFDSVANITKYFSIRHLSFKDMFFQNTRWISYWLNAVHYSIGKFDPFSYRLGNLIIHSLNGLLIFFILFLGLKNLKKRNFFSNNALSISFFTSILFLLHPVQTQTVSYVIQGQLEGLAALFILSMILCFYQLTQTKNVITKAVLTFLLFILALFSCGTKEIAIISPALLILFDWFFVAQGKWSSLKKRWYIHAALGLFVFGIYLYFLKPDFFTSILGLQKIAQNNIGNVITQNPHEAITPWMFFRSQFKVILHYIWIFIWPFNISVEYDWVLSQSIFYPDALLPLIVILFIGLGIGKILKKNFGHLVAFGALWFFGCLAPRCSIIPSPELLVDYKTYLASFGWLFLLASAIVWGIKKGLDHIQHVSPLLKEQHYGLQTAVILFGLLLGSLTVQRNTVWRSGVEFWDNIIKNAPGKARAYNNYGVELSQNRRDYLGSIPYFQKAISMDSNYSDPHNNLAVAYSHLGRLDEAINALKKSLDLQPYCPEGHNNLAAFYIQKKQFEQAEKSLSIALKLRPHYGKAFFNLGRINLQRGNKEKAWECFKKSCTEADFDIPYGFDIYARTSMDLKKYDDAIFGYQKLLQCSPNDNMALFNLANAYYLSGKLEEAKKRYHQLTIKTPDDFKAWYNLGETYFNLHEYAQALDSYKKTYKMRTQLPYLQIRMAHCLEMTGKPYEAKEMLQTFLREPHGGNNEVLAQLTEKTKSILAQMQVKYPGEKPAVVA